MRFASKTFWTSPVLPCKEMLRSSCSESNFGDSLGISWIEGAAFGGGPNLFLPS
jgi:hypothetical protein